MNKFAFIQIAEHEGLGAARVTTTADSNTFLLMFRIDGTWIVRRDEVHGNVELLKSAICAEAIRADWAGKEGSLSRTLEDWAAA